MRKQFYIVEKNSDIIAVKMWKNGFAQEIYKTWPKQRKGLKIQYGGLICGEASLILSALFTMNPSFSHSLAGIVILLAAMFPILISIGTVIRKNIESSTRDVKLSKAKVGPWLDPYGIARDAADVPGKKTYYIVDGGKNAIVDVKRLGKWGQRYVAWRGKRQKQKTE